MDESPARVFFLIHANVAGVLALSTTGREASKFVLIGHVALSLSASSDGGKSNHQKSLRVGSPDAHDLPVCG